MQKGFISALCLVVVLLFTGTARAQELHLSQPFATVEGAVTFARTVYTGTEPFLCEYAEGSPSSASWRVYYKDLPVGELPQNKMWQALEGFESLEEARAFVKGHDGLPQFVPCWNPNKNPASTTITLFYQDGAVEGSHVEKAFGPFPSARDAAAYANKSLNAWERAYAQFVPQLFSTRQVESSWYVVTVDTEPANDALADAQWRVIEQDQRGVPFDAKSAAAALYAASADDYFFSRIVSTFNTWSTASRVVLFVLENAPTEDIATFRAQTNAVLLGIPATLFVDQDAPLEPTNIVNSAQTAFESFFDQTQIAVWGDRVRTYAGGGRNPRHIAQATPRIPNTLNIFFSATPPSPPDHTNRIEPGLNGEKYLIIWVRPHMPSEELASAVIHALAHKFTAQDSDDPASAMFFDGIHKGSSLTIDQKNLVLITQMAKLAKKWGSVDIAFLLTD